MFIVNQVMKNMLPHPFFGRKRNELLPHFIKNELLTLALFCSEIVFSKNYFRHFLIFVRKQFIQ